MGLKWLVCFIGPLALIGSDSVSIEGANIMKTHVSKRLDYRNTIAGSKHDKQIFIFFEKIRFASQKTAILNFCF